MLDEVAIEKALFGPMNVVLKDTLIVQKDLAMMIDSPPRFVQAFFRPVRSGLSKPRYRHVWTLVLGILLNLRRSKRIHLTGVLPDHGHRTAHGVFLSRSDRGPAELMDTEVKHVLRRMKRRRGEVIYLVIDDTRIPKRGKKMFGVSKIWDHKQQRFVHGHIVVCAAVLFRGVTLPWRFELWLSKRWAGRSYRQSTEIAAEMVRAFDPPKGLKVRLVFSKRPRSAWKAMVAFATNETKLAARAIVSIYEKRWTIEVLFKELRGDLGLGDYQVLSKDAIRRHLHLCGLAHLLLTHHSMDTVGAQARKANTEVPLPTMNERLTALRNRVRRDQLRHWLKGPRHRRLRDKNETYLLAA